MRLVIVPVALGFFVSLLVALVAWNIQIERRAFHCNDDIGFGYFWEDLGAHEKAGDTVSPGWTWEKLRTTQIGYEIAFFSLWLIAVAMQVTITRSRRRRAALPA